MSRLVNVKIFLHLVAPSTCTLLSELQETARPANVRLYYRQLNMTAEQIRDTSL